MLHCDGLTHVSRLHLRKACYTGKLACIQELLAAGASTKIVDQNGRNALHHACRKDQDNVVRFLVQVEKMDVNAVSENKDTPLHKAGQSFVLYQYQYEAYGLLIISICAKCY